MDSLKEESFLEEFISSYQKEDNNNQNSTSSSTSATSAISSSEQQQQKLGLTTGKRFEFIHYYNQKKNIPNHFNNYKHDGTFEKVQDHYNTYHHQEEEQEEEEEYRSVDKEEYLNFRFPSRTPSLYSMDTTQISDSRVKNEDSNYYFNHQQQQHYNQQHHHRHHQHTGHFHEKYNHDNGHQYIQQERKKHHQNQDEGSYLDFYDEHDHQNRKKINNMPRRFIPLREVRSMQVLTNRPFNRYHGKRWSAMIPSPSPTSSSVADRHSSTAFSTHLSRSSNVNYCNHHPHPNDYNHPHHHEYHQQQQRQSCFHKEQLNERNFKEETHFVRGDDDNHITYSNERQENKNTRTNTNMLFPTTPTRTPKARPNTLIHESEHHATMNFPSPTTLSNMPVLMPNSSSYEVTLHNRIKLIEEARLRSLSVSIQAIMDNMFFLLDTSLVHYNLNSGDPIRLNDPNATPCRCSFNPQQQQLLSNNSSSSNVHQESPGSHGNMKSSSFKVKLIHFFSLSKNNKKTKDNSKIQQTGHDNEVFRTNQSYRIERHQEFSSSFSSSATNLFSRIFKRNKAKKRQTKKQSSSSFSTRGKRRISKLLKSCLHYKEFEFLRTELEETISDEDVHDILNLLPMKYHDSLYLFVLEKWDFEYLIKHYYL